uniref:Translation initiation factor eIF2B subunit gamma n=1 Tax=Talaromyces marneffei PM1 TaxID=1077442 RepID=A0A093XU05_TALMA
MPHSVPVPFSGFQAIILCGPGVSLNTFTSNPEEFPKALIPIANRPMVWYPLDWCYRMGITMTPPASQAPLEAALSQNPHLTSLPAPSPSVLAPSGLTLTTGTAELLRFPEVQSAIKSDFVLLPCDLICDIPGEALLESWMVSQASLSGSGEEHGSKHGGSVKFADVRGENAGRRGGLGVWYQTRDKEESVKGEVADFVATAPLDQNETPAVYPPVDGPGSIRYNLSKLVYAMPMDSLKEKMEEEKGLLIRHSLINKHARVKLLTTYRDAHIYVFPYWVKELARRNEKFQSISEDLVGWWAKAEWQKGLGEKLGLREIFEEATNAADNASHDGNEVEDEVDLRAMSTTKACTGEIENIDITGGLTRPRLASRVNTMTSEADFDIAVTAQSKNSKLAIPPVFAYIHSSLPSAPLVRRVDSSALLLSVSLKLAKLESIEEVGRPNSSPFAHAAKVAYPAGIAQRCTVTRQDCLLAENVTVEEKCVIKESVIGANCHIATGARLTRCVVMAGAVIGPRSVLTGCVIGNRSKIGRECNLKDCEVQDGNAVPDETDAKNEKFMVFEGLDTEDGEEGGMSMDEDGEMGGDDGKGFDEGGTDLGF